MNIALIIFASLLTFASIGSAIAKIKKVPDVMASMASVGVKPNQVPTLAFLEIGGGPGVIGGIWNPSFGLLASACLALFFVGAVVSHLSKKHGPAEFGAALGILIISIITTILQLQR